ncbi:MAG: glutathione synthase [Desulfobacterales bacterium]|nr:glutathione synthase [Desulfobacterales bacterium]
MAAADAVILPQGCSRILYRLARRLCPRVFPNYDARFAYPGKTGQVRLFRKFSAPHPETRLYPDTATVAASCLPRPPMAVPFVFKFDWGGEGKGVYRIEDPDMLRRRLMPSISEPPSPCLVQEYVPHGQKTLRVVVIGTTTLSYWKVVQKPGRFGASLARGAVINTLTDPDLQAAGKEAVRDFCQKSGIDLAGFDLIFPEDSTRALPLFLEINYFFGRRGLGGSERFYEMLKKEIRDWLARKC